MITSPAAQQLAAQRLLSLLERILNDADLALIMDDQLDKRALLPDVRAALEVLVAQLGS